MLDHALFCYEARKEVREHSRNKEKLWRFGLCKYKGSFSFSQSDGVVVGVLFRRAIRSSENQTDGDGGGIPIALMTPSLTM